MRRTTFLGLAPILAASGIALAQGAGGYYTDFNEFSVDPADGIGANGLKALPIIDIGGYNFDNIELLVVNETSNIGISDALLGALPAIQDWVEAGGKLIVHDRYVSLGNLAPNPLMVGAPDTLALRDFSNDADVDILLPGTEVTEGSFGTLDDSSLDGGNSSSHGYVDGGTLPGGAVAILNRGGADNEIVGFSYPLGEGAVYYSTIPLDYYLAGNGDNPPLDNLALIYYPNVIEYMLNLSGAGCPADCNGDGELSVLDFVCFQGEWQNQTAAGDCNGDGQYSILDFVCYQGQFQQGCP